MPIYEYRCEACHKITSQFVRNLNNPSSLECYFCRSIQLTRLISRVATPRSEDRRMESLADPSSLDGLDENDPQQMTQWMKTMAGEMGQNLDDDTLAAMESPLETPPGENEESAL